MVGVFVALLAAVGASASPSIQEKRAQAQAILQQVEQLDAEVGDAAERWNGANYRLDQISQQQQSAEADLLRAKQGVKVSQARVGARLRELYVNGEPASAVEVLLGARSLNEIIDVLDATERITSQDSRIATELKGYRKRVLLRRQQLAEARTEQAAVVRQRAAEKAAIEARLAERQRLLASVKDEIVRLEEAERRRQAELRRQAQLELERQQAAAAAAAASAARRQAEQQAETEAAAVAAPAPPSDAESVAADTSISAPLAPVAPPADASKGAQVVAIAMQYLGIKYVWGAASPSVGFDCSGLTMYVFNQVGVSLPHYAAAQYGMGVAVSKDQLQPGDLVFFRGLGHMGMYIGGGNMIHAPRTGDVVKISPLSDPYYVANWVGARRVL
jgi:cell wall-associated NlpC family hydrolase